MEEQKKELEEVTLNQEEGGASESNDNEDTKTTYTAEEVKAMRKEWQSNTEQGVQKIIKEKKETDATYQTVLSEISRVAENKERLVELYEENPKVAKIILEKYYDGQSIGDFKESIGYEEDLTDPKIIEKKISSEADKRVRDRIISDKTEEFIKKLAMSDDEKEKFMEAFEDRKNLKSFNADDIGKHLEKAYREIADDETLAKLKKDEVIARTMATGDGKGGGGTNKGKFDVARESARSFLRNNGL